MAVTTTDLAAYLRLPPDSSDTLSSFLAAARSRARAAGIPEYQHNAQYDLFMLALAGMYYENRSLAFSGSYQATAEANATRMVNAFVLELRHAGEDPVIEDPEDGDSE